MSVNIDDSSPLTSVGQNFGKCIHYSVYCYNNFGMGLGKHHFRVDFFAKYTCNQISNPLFTRLHVQDKRLQTGRVAG